MIRRVRYIVTCLAALTCSPLLAKPRPLQAPEIPVEARSLVHYRCDGAQAMTAIYFNGVNGQSFALLDIDGVKRLFVATLSASGVKYQADHYIWWSKGQAGNLYDLRKGDNAAAVRANCSVSPQSPNHAPQRPSTLRPARAASDGANPVKPAL